jgi:phage host-nuclease inhibitor protein Gam
MTTNRGMHPMENANGQAPTPATTIATEDRLTAIDREGYVFDADTGEVLGHDTDLVDDGFRVTSPEGADWVLEKLAYEEAQLARIEMLRAAQMAHLDSMMVEPRNRLAWLHRRFDGELVAQAQRDLEAQGGRSRTAKYPHGKVSLRKSPGSAEILDNHAAVSFVAEWAPDHVRMSVGVEAVRAAILAEADAIEEAEGRTDTARLFRHAEPSERWTIDTGIGTKGGKP